MNCHKPFVRQGLAFGCGQCLPCRINRKRTWAHRLMLEAKDHAENTFVTLTYSDDKIPADGSLRPADSRNFLKKLRSRMEPQRFRYYLVGEYGDISERPHYHAALFGYPSCKFGRSRYSKLRVRCCEPCDLIQETWGLGHVLLGDLTVESAAYMAGYVTKKLTKPDDPRLNGRHPEFARMSNRPGIGAGAADELADCLLKYPTLVAQVGDVPTSLRHGKRQYPLGRYIRQRTRLRIGLPKNAPQIVMETARQKMRLLQETVEKELSCSLPLEASLLFASRGKRAQIAHRFHLYRKRGNQ